MSPWATPLEWQYEIAEIAWRKIECDSARLRAELQPSNLSREVASGKNSEI